MKRFISIIIIIISLIAFAYVGILFTIDYKKVQQEFISLFNMGSTSEITVNNVEIKKFPLPKIIARNVKISGFPDLDEVTVNFSIASILKRAPQITTIEIHYSGFNVVISAKYAGNQLFYEKFNVRTDHVAEFLKEYPDLASILKSNMPSYENNLLFDLVLSDENITLTNLKLNSQIFSCEGEAVIPKNSALSRKLNMNCSKILIGNEELREVSISGEYEKDILKLNVLKGSIASGGDFNIVGNLTKNNFRSAFSGKAQINFVDLNNTLNQLGLTKLSSKLAAKSTVDSDFKATPAELQLNQMKGQIGMMGFAGSSYIKVIGGLPRLMLNFNVNGFDSSSDYPALTPLFNYMSSLIQGTQDRNYISKLTPIRDLNFLGDFTISLINPVILGVESDKLNLHGNIIPGKIDVKSIDYSADQDKLSCAASLDTVSIKPTFNLKILNGTWNTDALKISNLLYINSLMQNGDFAKLNLLASVNLDTLTQGDITLTNVKFGIKNDSNILTIPYFQTKNGSSEIQLSGNITTGSNMGLDFAYVYNSADLGSLARFLGFNLGLDGIANFAGNVSSRGSSIEELLYKLSTNSKFIASSLEVYPFSIDDLITKITPLNYNKKNLDQDIKAYISSGSTHFNGITGDLNMSAGNISLSNVSFTSKYTTGTSGGVYNIYNQDLDFSSLWSFQISMQANTSVPTSIKINFQRKGGKITQNIVTENLLKSFESRALQSILNNPASAVAPPILPKSAGE